MHAMRGSRRSDQRDEMKMSSGRRRGGGAFCGARTVAVRVPAMSQSRRVGFAALLLVGGVSGWATVPARPCAAFRPAISTPCTRRVGRDVVLRDEAPSAVLIGSAIAIGVITGVAVAGFKTSIAAVVAACYEGDSVVENWGDRKLGAASVFIPAAGGVVVSIMRSWSPRNSIGPSLAEHVAEVERVVPLRLGASARRGVAAVATLGTGSALGPEGPSVELGVGVSRFVADAAAQVFGGSGGAVVTPFGLDPEAASLRRQRQLVAAGAAAGVAAGFNAPLAGVFFALEIVSEAVRSAAVVEPEGASGGNTDSNAAPSGLSRRDTAELDVKSKEAISATVISALIASFVVQQLLGSELALRPGLYSLRSPALELPLYVGLGALSGGVALLFEKTSATSRSVFNSVGAPATPPTAADGAVSSESDAPPASFMWSGEAARPVLGGLACGLVGLAFPQVLFFGYSTLNAILAAGDTDGAAESLNAVGRLATELSGGVATSERLDGFGGLNLLLLLFAKLLATSICIGSGLVGGTFAPSLFFGAVLGAFYQAFAGEVLENLADAIAAYQISIDVPVGSWGVIPQLTVADAPAYALVGAAATLASVFRAPLTASLLFLEQTRGYDIVLPLLAACGTGPLVVDYARRRSNPPPATSANNPAGDVLPVRLVMPPLSEECEAEVLPEDLDACEVEPYVVLPEECDVDNRVAFCLEDGDVAEDNKSVDAREAER